MELLIGDAFGTALLDHLENGDGWHVIERDDGMLEAMSTDLFFRDPTDWPTGEAQALGQTRGRVLDIGAGAGRYAVVLEEQGYNVVALDVSAGAVEVCRRRSIGEVFHGPVLLLGPSAPIDVGRIEEVESALPRGIKDRSRSVSVNSF